MRYPDTVGLVWNSVARLRDKIAQNLEDVCDCVFAYPSIGDSPHFVPRHAGRVALNLYSKAPHDIQGILSYCQHHNVVAILYMSASAAEIPKSVLKSKGIALLTTENASFDEKRRDPWPKRLTKDILRRILKQGILDIHIPNSEANARFLQNFARFPASRIHTAVNGIDLDHFAPLDKAAACSSIGLDPDKFWIMCASQARPEKRFDMLLDAAEQVCLRLAHKKIGFFHVGGGGYIGDWKMQCTARGLDNIFQFMGYHVEMSPYYSAASLFIHAAYRESFGSVIAEAMCCRLPVVATRSMGPAEIILDGETGRVVGKNDLVGFVDAICDYVSNVQLAESHGAAGRKRVLKTYNVARQASTIAGLIRTYVVNTAYAPARSSI